VFGGCRGSAPSDTFVTLVALGEQGHLAQESIARIDIQVGPAVVVLGDRHGILRLGHVVPFQDWR